MNTQLDFGLADGYNSRSQQARIITESWAGANMYCVACSASNLTRTPANRPTVDFFCASCDELYQLKSSVKPFSTRVVDGAYQATLQAMERGSVPNLLLLSYDRGTPAIRDLDFIPKFALMKSALQCRPPLSATARRAGWVGCNILLSSIPSDVRIAIVRSGLVTPPDAVRAKYRTVSPLSQLTNSERGWTLDVLNAIRSLRQQRFSLNELYGHESRLKALHPKNRHIKEKIRQQLQVLRDLGVIEFLSPGQYCVRDMPRN